MDGQWVMMPVRCMGKQCEFCKYLELEIDRTDIFYEGEYRTSDNIIQCKSVHRCQCIENMLEDRNHDKRSTKYP